jgi:hypothetical protein
VSESKMTRQMNDPEFHTFPQETRLSVTFSAAAKDHLEDGFLADAYRVSPNGSLTFYSLNNVCDEYIPHFTLAPGTWLCVFVSE